MRYSYSRQQTWTWTVVCSCLSMWVASQSWGYENARSAVGLAGLLPASAPDGLTEQDFSDLTESIDETWKDWIRETAGLVKDLYENTPSTLVDQRYALDRLKVKLSTIEKALSDPRYESIFPELIRLYGRLSQEVDVADAMLVTLTQGPESARRQRLKPSFDALQGAVGQVQEDLSQFSNAQEWRNWANLSGLTGLQPDSPNALETVTAVKQRFEARESYSPPAKEFISRESFLQLEDALGAILKISQEKVTFDEAGLRTAYSDLLDQLSQYRAQPSVDLEGAIRQALERLREQSPDGGAAIADALGRQVLNFNLRIVATEGLLNRLLQQTRTEQDQIRDRVMEANVYGTQVTQVTTSVKLIPDSLTASFNLALNGVVRSNTNGYTSRATIQSHGYHVFSATKKVDFDGQEFKLGTSLVSARANMQAVGARTGFSHVPLLGRMANNIAIREANSRNPQTNAIAAQRIRQRIAPRMDQEASERFSNASKDLQTRYGALRKYNLYPEASTWSTTDLELHHSSRVMDTQELGGSVPPPVAQVPENGLFVQVHESLLTHAFDRFGLKGQTMTEDQVRDLLESRLSEILGREVKIARPQAAEVDTEQKSNTLVFEEKDAIRFTIDNGIVTVFIRAGLKRESGEEIPTQIISVPFTPTLSNGQILLTRGNVGVKPVSRPPNVAAQVTRAQVMRQKIQSALPERTIDGKFEVKQADKQVELNVVELTAEGGWLAVGLK